MRTRPRIVLLSLAFLFAVQTAAQQTTTPAPTRDPTAVALLSKSLAVMTGGMPLSDVTLQGSARRIAGSDDETGTAVLKALASGEARIDLSFPSGSRSEVHATSADGPAGVWSGPDAVKHPIAQHNLWTDSCWFFPALTFVRLSSSPSYSLSYVGQETRSGRTVVHVSASQIISARSGKFSTFVQHLSQMDILLDSASLLPVAVFFNAHADGDAGLDIQVEIRFSDYHLINGAQVPFHVQKHLNNGLVLDLQLQSVSLNSGLSPASFSIQ